MKNTKSLGLPLEYQEKPELFDAHNIDPETAKKNALVAQLLTKYSCKEILDVTCGSGSQVLFLAQQGFSCVGADFSPDLIKQAAAKAQAQNLDIKFMHADMRSIQAGKFDAVIAIFNAIGHLSKADFIQTLHNLKTNLQPGGIFVFDIFNLEALNDQVIEKFALYKHAKVGSTNIHHVQVSTLDKDAGLLTSYDTYVLQKGAGVPDFLRNDFSLQIYTSKELDFLLKEAGFEMVELSDFAGTTFDKEKTVSMLCVGQRP